MAAWGLKRIAHAVCVLVCAVSTPAAYAADLLGVVESTLDHDATLAASRDAYRAAMQAVPKARAGLLPRVQGGWGRAYNGIVMESFPTMHYWQSGWTVSLVQPVFDWSLWTAYRQADYVVARGRLEAAAAAQDAILRAAQAYFDGLAAEDELARANAYRQALDAHYALLLRAKAAGEVTLIDLREAESSRSQAQVQWLDAQSQTRLARVALERLTGAPVDALATLPARAAPPALQPADVEPWVTQAQTRAYPVQIGEMALQVAKFDTEKAQAAHYPNVALQFTHTPAGAGGGYSRPTTTTTGMLQVTIPVFSGGETTALTREAQALEDKARDELEAAVREAAANARDGWLRVNAGAARSVALAQSAQHAQDALEATRIGFRAGSRTSFDVLRATDTLYASQRDQIRARYDTVLALLKLLAEAAILDLDEVGRINTQLFAHEPGGAAMQPMQPMQQTRGNASRVSVPARPEPLRAEVPHIEVARIEAQPPQQAPHTAAAAPAPLAPAPSSQAPARRSINAADLAPATAALGGGYLPITP